RPAGRKRSAGSAISTVITEPARRRSVSITTATCGAARRRTRKQLVREQTRHVQRIEKTLAEANIKLSSVISDIMGASGRRMIQAMIDGVRQPRQLAELAGKQIKATPKELYDALHGRLTDHHRFLLALHLKQWDGLDE